jgi:hypothetical protein
LHGAETYGVWWLASPYLGTPQFNYVSNDGRPGGAYSSQAGVGIAPVFCIK